MKVLTTAGRVIFSLILLLALTVFGPALTLNRTVLNAGFITSEVGRLEVAPLGNALAPLQWLGIGIIVGGVAMMAVSFVYKARDPVD